MKDQFSKKELEQILGGSSPRGVLTSTSSKEVATMEVGCGGVCRRSCAPGCSAGCMGGCVQSSGATGYPTD